MKHKIAIIGGAIGLLIHVRWHGIVDIPLLSIGPHIIRGTAYTLGGAIIGYLIELFFD